MRRLVGTVLVLGLVACADPGTVERGAELGGDSADASPTASAGAEPAVAPSCDDLEPEPEVDGPLSGDEEVAAAQRARASVGLPSDEATLRELMARTEERDWVYPFPHTDEELDELRARNRRTIDTGEVHDWIAAEAADDYAGMWVDNSNGSVPVVAFADRVDEHREALQERWGEQVRVVARERPYRELEALQDRVTEDMAGQPTPHGDSVYPEPGTLLQSGIDDTLNRVRVGVVGGNDVVLAAVTERYGAERVCLEVRVAPEPMDYDGPVRPLVKAEGWREGLHDINDAFALVEIAYDRATAERAWTDNVPAGLPEGEGDPARPGRYGTLDDVDFDSHAVVVWSSGESGSCPGWLAGIDTTAEGDVEPEEGSTGLGGCEGDYNPYRMLLAVDRDRLPAAGDLPVESGFPETVVVAYPLAP